MTISNISFDPVANAAYVMVSDNKVYRSEVYKENGVVIDYDYKGNLVGIEFLHASRNTIIDIAQKFKLRLLEAKATPISKMLQPA